MIRLPRRRGSGATFCLLDIFLVANLIELELVLRLPVARRVWLGLGTAVTLVGAVASWWIASVPHPNSIRMIFGLVILAGTSGALKLIERNWPLTTGEILLKRLETATNELITSAASDPTQP